MTSTEVFNEVVLAAGSIWQHYGPQAIRDIVVAVISGLILAKLESRSRSKAKKQKAKKQKAKKQKAKKQKAKKQKKNRKKR